MPVDAGRAEPVEHDRVLGHGRPRRGVDHGVEVEVVGAPVGVVERRRSSSSNGVRSSTSGCDRRGPRPTRRRPGPRRAAAAAEVDRRSTSSHAGPRVDQLAAGRGVARAPASASVVDLTQAASVIGASSRSRWFTGTPRSRRAGCRCARLPGARRAPAPSVLGGLLDLEDVAVGEEVGAQHLVELRVVAAQPLEGHGEVLLLLVAVVGEHLGQLGVGGRRDPLVVPVDGLELLHDRHDRPVAVDDVGREAVLVELGAAGTHGASYPVSPESPNVRAVRTGALRPCRTIAVSTAPRTGTGPWGGASCPAAWRSPACRTAGQLGRRACGRGRSRPACPTMLRTIWWQNAFASISNRSTPSPRSSQRARPPAARATPAVRRRRGFGAARQNDEKSCSPMSGSQARRSSRRSSGRSTCHAVRGQEGVGHRPVEHRVAVDAGPGREPGVEVGRGDLGRVAHHDRRAAQLG